MEIKLAKEMGFCFGVRRGISLVERVAQERGPIQTLGSLVHNRQVIERMAALGILQVDSLDEVQGKALVIATHGVPRAILDEAKGRGLDVIDATCPYVRAIHDKVSGMHEAGFQVIVFGDEGHTEVVGIVGWTEGQAIVIRNRDDLENLSLARKVGIVAQTTKNLHEYESIVKRLVERCLAASLELRVHNTICSATAERQDAVLELASSVDAVLVVGGRNSANTARLAEICRSKSVPTYHIETAREISPSWFAHYSCIGITAGASTPDWVIQEVVDTMKALESTAWPGSPEASES
jgi:4-hydroxy-3-methylbut-2-enyl diphosphate reductase